MGLLSRLGSFAFSLGEDNSSGATAAGIIGGPLMGEAFANYENEREYNAEQARIAEENTRLYELEVAENIRRSSLYNEQNLGLARVQAGASGFAVGSSVGLYVDTINAEQEADVDWMRTSGASSAALQRKTAESVKRFSDRQAKSTLISNSVNVASKVFSFFGGGFGGGGSTGGSSSRPSINTDQYSYQSPTNYNSGNFKW